MPFGAVRRTLVRLEFGRCIRMERTPPVLVRKPQRQLEA